MAYEITLQDFQSIVINPPCQGKEIEGGAAKQGHESCTACKGNYFVKGECNYGGCHKLEQDLKEINRNFRSFDVLITQQAKLSKSKKESEFQRTKQTLLNSFQSLKAKCEDKDGEAFFYGSCVGIGDSKINFQERVKDSFKRLAKELGHYIQQVEKTTWQQLHQFQVKLQQLNKLSQEANDLTEEWKNEQDQGKKDKLFVLLEAKDSAIAKLRVEISQDPTFAIFSQEKSDELANIVKNIFQGNPNQSFFDWSSKEKEDKTESNSSDKYFGLLPKESTNNLLLLLGGILAIVFIYQYWSKKQ